MKKLFLTFCMWLMTMPAFAGKPIDLDTKIKWKPIVVVAAMHDAGIRGDKSDCWERIYTDILGGIAEKKTCSLGEAIEICATAFATSVVQIYEGRGCNLSVNDMADMCSEFAVALYKENNKNITHIYLGDDAYHPAGRVYSKDKKFYVDSLSSPVKIKYWDEYVNCYDAVFEATTNKKIAVCAGFSAEDGWSETEFKVTDSKYKKYEFSLNSQQRLTRPDEGRAWLHYTLESKYF